MPTVTLETLRTDFEAARQNAAASVKDWLFTPDHVEAVTVRFSNLPISAFMSGTLKASISLGETAEIQIEVDTPADVRLSANIIDVAEKHGLEAAMLYKLSDGAIDPRKAGEA